MLSTLSEERKKELEHHGDPRSIVDALDLHMRSLKSVVDELQEASKVALAELEQKATTTQKELKAKLDEASDFLEAAQFLVKQVGSDKRKVSQAARYQRAKLAEKLHSNAFGRRLAKLVAERLQGLPTKPDVPANPDVIDYKMPMVFTVGTGADSDVNAKMVLDGINRYQEDSTTKAEDKASSLRKHPARRGAWCDGIDRPRLGGLDSLRLCDDRHPHPDRGAEPEIEGRPRLGTGSGHGPWHSYPRSCVSRCRRRHGQRS
jgi:hypothetical protein